MIPDIAAVSSLVEDAARKEILPRFRRLRPAEVWEKRPGDPVTEADVAMERTLQQGLMALVPGSVMIGEEEFARRPEILDRLDGAAPVWIVDPLDGTANFAAGLSLFAVMVAFSVAEEVRAAWIHDPITGVTATATVGEGAWIGPARLHVASPAPLAGMSGRLSYRTKDRALRRRIAEKSAEFAEGFNFRCVGQEYLALARGLAHFALYFRLRPWDHAAGHLIHREAGGYSAQLDGSPYRLAPFLEGILLAPDERSWVEIHRRITGT